MITRTRLIAIGKSLEWMNGGTRAVGHLDLTEHSTLLVAEFPQIQKEIDELCRRDNPRGWRAKGVAKRYAHTQAIFNRLRRLELANDELLVDCFTCENQQMVWNDANKVNCGHFVKAKFRILSFDRRNTKIQCVECNKWKGGAESAYHNALDQEQDGLANELRAIRDEHRNYRHEIEELAALLMLFKVELALEGHRRGIEPKLTQH